MSKTKNRQQVLPGDSVIGTLDADAIAAAAVESERNRIAEENKVRAAEQSKRDSEATAALTRVVNNLTDTLRELATKTSTRMMDIRVLNGNADLSDVADLIKAAAEFRKELKAIAQNTPGACCTLYNGEEAMFNPLVSNPDNPKGTNSWPPSQIWAMFNRESVNVRKLRSTRKS